MGPERKLRIFIYARLVVSFLFLVSTLWLNIQEPGVVEQFPRTGMVRLMAISFLFSTVCLAVLKQPRFQLFITYLQTIWDLLFVTVLLLFTGGVTSPYSFLYLLSIMNAGVLLGRRQAIYTASLCAILYGAIIDFQFFGQLNVIGLSQYDAQQVGAARIFYTIFLNLMGFMLTGFITGFLAERTRETEAALHEKSVDFQELAQVHATIISRIDIGLLTTNRQGLIHVFNPHAEHVCGISRDEVLGMRVEELFPELQLQEQDLSGPVSGEMIYGRNGPSMVLGYTAAPFFDASGEHSGMLFSFKDLTGLRQMESALKRIDRLAALGELSARMAHEIRNPLAAMSGSVQLLKDHAEISDNDRRLLEIVVRETDRLNGLITDFLAYARPADPNRERFELRPLVEELRLLLASDVRFTQVTITSVIPAHMTIQADPFQLRQVLINLLNNAAEALKGSGSIEIESRFLLSGADGFGKAPVAVITVSDNGPGIDPESALHLFEPFWTSKPTGSGLGLAISYRIIEAHGGTLQVETPAEGGSRFVIMLPAY